MTLRHEGGPRPWKIRSHKTRKVLASFDSEAAAKEHLQRMKGFSKVGKQRRAR